VTRFSAGELAAIRDDFAAGIPFAITAARLGRGKGSVAANARKMGLWRLGPSPNSIRHYTPADREVVRRDYTAFVPVEQTARRLNRSPESIRQQILHMGLHRRGRVSLALTWAPRHLRALFGTLPDDEWVDRCYEWRSGRERQRADRERQARERQDRQLAAIGAAILARKGMSRDEKIVAMRVRGLALLAIGQQFGLTRERVRQIVLKGSV
jgi:hypothetical protein